MSGKSFLILVLTICWFVFCQRWYCCWMQNACAECNDEPINEYAIAFLPGSIDPDTTALWNVLVADLQKDKRLDHQLEVSGKYFPGKMESPNLGINRARNVAKLLQTAFPEDSIAFRAQAIHLYSGDTTESYLPLIDLQWIPAEQPEPKKISLFYALNTRSPTLTITNEKRLGELIDYAIKNNKKIKVDGHSSSTGSERVNIKLSKERALNIGKVLEAKEIPRLQIVTEGFGSSKPIFLDKPEKNKRVEISIIN